VSHVLSSVSEDVLGQQEIAMLTATRIVEQRAHVQSSPAERLHVAVAGAGEQASVHLLPTLLHLPGVRVAGVCDPDPARRRAVAERFAIPEHDERLDRLLDRLEVAAVVAACPPQAHEVIAETAISRRIPVFVEKPPAVTSAALDRLARLAEQAGVLTGVGMNFRHAGPYLRIKDLLTSPEAGRPVSVAVRHVASKPRAPLWSLPPLRSFLLAQAIHPADLLLDLGGPAEQVTAISHVSAGGGVMVSAQLRFASGAVGSLLAGSLAPRFDTRIELITDTGVLISLVGLSELTIAGLPAARAAGGSRGWSQQWRPSPLDTGYARTGFQGELAGFVAAVACGGVFTPSLADLRPAYALLDAIEQEAPR
jgi:phthalate 4,5-cis-dihydrodiol dehydrogenase